MAVGRLIFGPPPIAAGAVSDAARVVTVERVARRRVVGAVAGITTEGDVRSAEPNTTRDRPGEDKKAVGLATPRALVVPVAETRRVTERRARETKDAGVVTSVECIAPAVLKHEGGEDREER
jgi:hypothetical protein